MARLFFIFLFLVTLVGLTSSPAEARHRRVKRSSEEIQRVRAHWRLQAIQVAREEDVPVNIFLKLIHQESGFNPAARSLVGAIGLTQLMPATAESLGVNPYDPMENLRGGARYLRQMLVQFRGDLRAAVAAYNAGPLAVTAYRTGQSIRCKDGKVINPRRLRTEIPPYRETVNYVASILTAPDVGPIPPPSVNSVPPPTTGNRIVGSITIERGGQSTTRYFFRSTEGQ